MTKDDIQAEFDNFIEFPPGSDKRFVTTTSTLIFAEYISVEAVASFLQRNGKYVTNAASREAAIAEAVLAEREACANLSPNSLHISGAAKPHEVWQQYREAIRARNHLEDKLNMVTDGGAA